MSRIEVQPDQLGAGRGRQVALANRVTELGGQLKVATATAASPAGDGNAAGAIGSFGEAWASALD